MSSAQDPSLEETDHEKDHVTAGFGRHDGLIYSPARKSDEKPMSGFGRMKTPVES
jgi:hypothetical protein